MLQADYLAQQSAIFSS